MDIKGNNPYPSGDLSNFAAHRFIFRGIECQSMEGLLQSLKFNDAQEQIAVCQLTGKAAKAKGLEKDWRTSQTLWWQGAPIARDSAAYQQFLDEAFAALFTQNTNARNALLATAGQKLEHSIGVTDPTQTVLTTEEFCSHLTQLRTNLLKKPAVKHQPKI